MNPLLAQVTESFWRHPNGSSTLLTKVALALLVGAVAIGLLIALPPKLRRPVIAGATFLSGLYYVLLWIWPEPIARQDGQLPNGPVEGVGFWLIDANGVVTDFAQILTSFMLGLGIYSLLRVHVGRLSKMKGDWFFSAVLLLSMAAMIFFGYWDFFQRQGPGAERLDNPANWTLANYGRDLLFDGLLQQMDAAMFSIIAFFIISAAYRAFRIRSIEATILLSSALIVMLSLMGAVSYVVDGAIMRAAGDNPESFLANFELSSIAGWLRGTFQTASLQGIAFGIGIGALAMGLRLWLSLEKAGGN